MDPIQPDTEIMIQKKVKEKKNKTLSASDVKLFPSQFHSSFQLDLYFVKICYQFYKQINNSGHAIVENIRQHFIIFLLE